VHLDWIGHSDVSHEQRLRFERGGGDSMSMLQRLMTEAVIRKAILSARQERARWTPRQITDAERAWAPSASDGGAPPEELDPECSAWLMEFVARNPSIKELWAAESNATLVCMGTQTTNFYQGADLLWQRALREGKTTIGKIEDTGRTAGDPPTPVYGIDLYFPIRSEAQGGVSGVARARFERALGPE
jgi:hypothetical protein